MEHITGTKQQEKKRNNNKKFKNFPQGYMLNVELRILFCLSVEWDYLNIGSVVKNSSVIQRPA